MTENRLKTHAWATQDEADELAAAIAHVVTDMHDFEARLAVFERALRSVIEDIDEILGAPQDEKPDLATTARLAHEQPMAPEERGDGSP